jgi:protein involved in polysaccharide export with SLBB domain
VLPAGKPAPAARYGISVRTWSGGDTVWQRSGLAESIVDGKRMVTAFVTGDVFAPGAYELSLTAGPPAAEVASYEVGVGPPKEP